MKPFSCHNFNTIRLVNPCLNIDVFDFVPVADAFIPNRSLEFELIYMFIESRFISTFPKA